MTKDDTATHSGNDLQSGGSPRQRAIEAYEGAADTLGEAPLIALAGGLAAGALIAALLPRTQTETRAVRPYARRAKDSARAAYAAAKDTGSDKLQELGITRDKSEDSIRSLFQGVGKAARASADAALDAAREPR